MLLPTSKLGTPDIDDKIYEYMRNKYLDGVKNGDEYLRGVYKKSK